MFSSDVFTRIACSRLDGSSFVISSAGNVSTCPQRPLIHYFFLSPTTNSIIFIRWYLWWKSNKQKTPECPSGSYVQHILPWRTCRPLSFVVLLLCWCPWNLTHQPTCYVAYLDKQSDSPKKHYATCRTVHRGVCDQQNLIRFDIKRPSRVRHMHQSWPLSFSFLINPTSTHGAVHRSGGFGKPWCNYVFRGRRDPMLVLEVSSICLHYRHSIKHCDALIWQEITEGESATKSND